MNRILMYKFKRKTIFWFVLEYKLKVMTKATLRNVKEDREINWIECYEHNLFKQSFSNMYIIINQAVT